MAVCSWMRQTPRKRENMLGDFSRVTYHLRREQHESARAFLTRWEPAMRKVRRDHKTELPEDYVGFLLVAALQLDDNQVKMMMNYTKGSLNEAAVKDWLRTHETKLSVNQLGLDKDSKTKQDQASTSSGRYSRELPHRADR
eukprot:TRINITY_DN78121_c0_g1_i1.p1 TRINITY_DN78121_c0_g1~~TRINITY_DN78121_c0_g1_i1.p1  ORF type:complete len:141 (-),score=20.88 TRINITY_DN78121_c0_g1_i1:127-549(-)